MIHRLILIGLALAFLFFFAFVVSRPSPPDDLETYRAWCRVEKRADVSYPDWKAMVRAGLLKP